MLLDEEEVIILVIVLCVVFVFVVGIDDIVWGLLFKFDLLVLICCC